MRVQRLAMYIVISMPKRKSMACGVSHFMSKLLVIGRSAARLHHPPCAGPPIRDDHESGAHDFHEPRAALPSCAHEAAHPPEPRRRRPDRPVRGRAVVAEIQNTRASVREEIEAANRVASQLLGRLAVDLFPRGRHGGGAAVPAAARARPRQRHHPASPRRGEVLYRSPPPTYKAGRAAPGWFARAHGAADRRGTSFRCRAARS